MKSAFVSIAAALLLALTPTAASAKNATVAIYAVVDQVTFEPDGVSPNVVRISGVFVVPIAPSSGLYHPPLRGYLYFRIRPGMEDAVRKDWNELKGIAGTGQVVGFGQYWVANPPDPQGNPHRSLKVAVHADHDSAPTEAYPVPHRKGIVKHGDQDDPNFDKIAAQLQKASH
jgi:hypothetical protein